MSSAYPYWFYLPAAVVYVVLFLLPTFASFYFSLTRWTLFDQHYIGLENFVLFFQEPALVKGLTNTLIYAVVTSGLKVLVGLPLAVLLFLFFPRLAGSFWALPRGDEAVTGLSDTMSPGGIGKLSTSYEVAFRARFEGELPPNEERYWRGPVLWDFDGRTWTMGPGFLVNFVAPSGGRATY